MFGSTLLPGIVAVGILSLAHSTYALQAIPCIQGAGGENGCGACDPTKAIEITPWNEAITVKDFQLPGAEAGSEEERTKGGYDVWWNIPAVDKDCHVILTTPFAAEAGSTTPNLSGNVVLRAPTAGGCLYAHVSSSGIGAAFCCGNGDCAKAGASTPPHAVPVPVGPITTTKKRELPRSRITRGLVSIASNKGAAVNKREKCWKGVCPEGPAVVCDAAIPSGEPYTKSGPQQIFPGGQSCNGGVDCDRSVSVGVSTASSLTTENSVTNTETESEEVTISAGMNVLAFSASATAGFGYEWSKAVMESTGMAQTTTETTQTVFNMGAPSGAKYDVWFTPDMDCQMIEQVCNGVLNRLEKCDPAQKVDGVPRGESGITIWG